MFYERVENAFQEEYTLSKSEEDEQGNDIMAENTPIYHAEMEMRIKQWVDADGYLQPGISLNELANQLCTNRTYLSEYIHTVYHISFRDWITDLRIEYAKRLMKQQPKLKVQEVSEACGFLSKSHFARTFTAKECCSPARWRDTNTQ